MLFKPVNSRYYFNSTEVQILNAVHKFVAKKYTPCEKGSQVVINSYYCPDSNLYSSMTSNLLKLRKYIFSNS